MRGGGVFSKRPEKPKEERVYAGQPKGFDPCLLDATPLLSQVRQWKEKRHWGRRRTKCKCTICDSGSSGAGPGRLCATADTVNKKIKKRMVDRRGQKSESFTWLYVIPPRDRSQQQLPFCPSFSLPLKFVLPVCNALPSRLQCASCDDKGRGQERGIFWAQLHENTCSTWQRACVCGNTQHNKAHGVRVGSAVA
jgi:hypothetical protein